MNYIFRITYDCIVPCKVDALKDCGCRRDTEDRGEVLYTRCLYRISNHGQPTRSGTTAWELEGEVANTLKCKQHTKKSYKGTRNVTDYLVQPSIRAVRTLYIVISYSIMIFRLY